MKQLRILIADDHPFVRNGLRMTIESQPGWKVCGEAATGREAVKMALALAPDVVAMDISMPDLNGLDATRQIRKASPSVEVLILTMHEAEPLVADVIEAGASGYVLKTDTPRLLVSAIESVAAHRTFYTGKISRMVEGGLLKQGAANGSGARHNHRLTAREREVVQLIAEGKTNKEIAVALGISVKTVDAHRTNVMRRLKLHSAAELVRYAIRNKIIEP